MALTVHLGFSNINREYFRFPHPPLDGMPVHRRVTPSSNIDKELGEKFVVLGNNVMTEPDL